MQYRICCNLIALADWTYEDYSARKEGYIWWATRDRKSRQREEIHEEGFCDGKNLEDIDAFYPGTFSVYGEPESDGELWYSLGP